MHLPIAVLTLPALGLLAAAAGAPAAAAALLAASAALPLLKSRNAGADYWEITPEQYFEKGLAHLKGDKAPQDLEKATEAFLAAAKKGHAGAQREMGVAHLTGRGADIDKYEALAWFQKAAEQDDPRSLYELASFLRRGYGVPEDKAQALANVQKAAELGYPKAQLELSRLLKEGGEGVEKDEKKAQELLEKAAAQEDAEAMTLLAETLEGEEGKDLERAGKLRRRLDELAEG
ncbi:MAG: sel1 repeat family protein [Deltaproteobacteria bacterium]|jgi:TPR repeat protein|nr:sel1 repeat family protein [Deltaproteobacteria bacterium]